MLKKLTSYTVTLFVQDHLVSKTELKLESKITEASAFLLY